MKLETSIFPFLAKNNIRLITGSPFYTADEENNRLLVFNAALLIEPNSEVSAVYTKRHLVPIVERLPFWNNPIAQKFYQDVIGLRGTWHVGKSDIVFPTTLRDESSVTLGMLICFEDSFGYLARNIVNQGGDLLINLTNNSWSRRDAAQIQHYTSARMRAIENRIGLVRSTNSGVTTVIDALGDNVAMPLPSFEMGFMHVQAPLYAKQQRTIYTVLGDYLGQIQMWGATLLYICLFIPSIRGRLRAKEL